MCQTWHTLLFMIFDKILSFYYTGMQKISNNNWLGPLTSGVLTFIAMCEINFWLSWICYIPLFISISNVSPGKAFKRGFLFGSSIAFLAFFWMIPGAERFTGHSIFYGIGVFIPSLIFLSLYHAGTLWCFAVLKRNEVKPRSLVINSLLIASVICTGEALLMLISEGFPWFDEHSGSGLSANLYSIQPASLFGVHVLSFVVVLVNYLTAYFIIHKLYLKLYIPVAVSIIYMSAGFLLFNSFNVPEEKDFRIAILAENILPEMKWDEHTGNMLVQQLIDLNRLAVSMKPDMILWSESGVPWTYSKDDDLIKEVLKITAPAQAAHILGMNTAYGKNEVFNSAYCILPDGKVNARYDKQHLLALIEKPLNGIVIPFFSSNGFIERNNNAYAAPLNTPYGKAGLLICNESVVPSAAANMVKQGAQFLCNMSNDGWFNDTYIVTDHFYTARLRAVESRKDLVINSNNGYSGLIKASGEIDVMKRSTEPFAEMVSVQPNNYTTPAALFPKLFVYGCACYVFIIVVINCYKKYRI